MERNVLLTLAGVAMGVAIGLSWWPPPNRPERTVVIERPAPIWELVPPGRRAVVRGVDGAPAVGVDVYLTAQAGPVVHRRVRTNAAGHLALAVPPGRYRVQASRGAEGLDRVIDVPAGEHPDLELRLETVSLFRLLRAP